ncbi:hypothetical protein QA802_36695 [Streptomyces sp. B21-105]|uniref:hypothetical protein n=1 Tax=Streptomyces sp. B21-105 TaxID=3039417 RepID=UPI002FF17BFF
MLASAGALVEHHDVPDVDHGYDGEDENEEAARASYALIARHIRQATSSGA